MQESSPQFFPTPCAIVGFEAKATSCAEAIKQQLPKAKHPMYNPILFIAIIFCQDKDNRRAKNKPLLIINYLENIPHLHHCPIIRHHRLIIGQKDARIIIFSKNSLELIFLNCIFATKSNNNENNIRNIESFEVV